MAKTIRQICDIVADFAERRGWQNDDPNQLISSILIEMGELAENYQWRSKFIEFDEEKKRVIGYEFVDVIFYLFQLANKSGIDIEKYFDEKLPKLEAKFKVGQNSKEHFEVKKHYRKSGKNKFYE